MSVLADSPAFDELQTLGLYKNGLEGPGVAAIAQSHHLRNLELLDLRSNRIRSAGAAALGSATGLPRLRELVLTGNTLRPEDVAALCGPGLPALERLNLQHTRLNDHCVDVLVNATAFCEQLRELSLRSNQLTNRAAERLAQCPALAGLVKLNLNGNRAITSEGINALRASDGLASTTIYAGNKKLTR